MRRKLDITLFSLLLGLMMAACLTIADGLSYSDNSYVSVDNPLAAEYHEEFELDAQDVSYTYISSRRRCSSSAQRHSVGKSQSRQYVSKASNSTSAKEHLLLTYSIRHSRRTAPQSSDYGNTIIVRFHRLLI